MTGFEQSRTLNVPFAAPKILVFLPRKFGGCRVFSANYGITWTQNRTARLGISPTPWPPEPAYHFCTTSPSARHEPCLNVYPQKQMLASTLGGALSILANSISGKCYVLDMSMPFCGSSFHNCLPWKWIWRDWFLGHCIGFLALHHPPLHSVVVDDLAGLLDISCWTLEAHG